MLEDVRRERENDMDASNLSILATVLDKANPVRPRGRRPVPTRLVIEALHYIVRNRCSWSSLPAYYPAASTVRSHLTSWRESGALQLAHERGLLPGQESPEVAANWQALIRDGRLRLTPAAMDDSAMPRTLNAAEPGIPPTTGDVRLSHLQTLETVAELGSFTRAAQVLNYAEPAVHHQVRRLEAVLGVPLLHYKHRQLRLTEQGEYLLPSIRSVRTSMSALDRAVRSLTDNDRLVLGTGRVTGPYTIIDFVARFSDEIQIEVRFDVDRADRLLEKLITGSVDVVISAMIDAYISPQRASKSNLKMVVWRQDRWSLVASPDSVEETRIVFTFSNLMTDKYADTVSAVLSAIPGAEIRNIESVDAVKVMASRGMGICLLPYSCIIEDITAGRLRLVSDLGSSGILPIYLLHRNPQFMNKAAKRMVMLLEREREWEWK